MLLPSRRRRMRRKCPDCPAVRAVLRCGHPPLEVMPVQKLTGPPHPLPVVRAFYDMPGPADGRLDPGCEWYPHETKTQQKTVLSKTRAPGEAGVRCGKKKRSRSSPLSCFEADCLAARRGRIRGAAVLGHLMRRRCQSARSAAGLRIRAAGCASRPASRSRTRPRSSAVRQSAAAAGR
jgi:hypothetical protein